MHIRPPGPAPVGARLDGFPFRDRSLGDVTAALDDELADTRLPLALARLHWAMDVGSLLTLRLDRPLDRGRLADLVAGGGFEMLPAAPGRVVARRARTLPDTVAPGLRALVCGLNPSVVAADAGYGYAGPSNRFWRTAVAAGLTTRPRDPLGMLAVDRVGMTDLVKRATPSAAALASDEYRTGAARVSRLVTWLAPERVLFVGLTGWRAAVDAHAVAGWQPRRFGGVPAYVMSSTSGLNAHASLDDLLGHLRAALEGRGDGRTGPVA